MLSKDWLRVHTMIGTGIWCLERAPGVRSHLLGTTGQRHIATNDVWVGYECEEQQACRSQSWHVVASEHGALAWALYRATSPLSTANLT